MNKKKLITNSFSRESATSKPKTQINLSNNKLKEPLSVKNNIKKVNNLHDSKEENLNDFMNDVYKNTRLKYINI